MKLYFVFFNKNSDVTNESKKGNLLFKKIKILSINIGRDWTQCRNNHWSSFSMTNQIYCFAPLQMNSQDTIKFSTVIDEAPSNFNPNRRRSRAVLYGIQDHYKTNSRTTKLAKINKVRRLYLAQELKLNLIPHKTKLGINLTDLTLWSNYGHKGKSVLEYEQALRRVLWAAQQTMPMYCNVRQCTAVISPFWWQFQLAKWFVEKVQWTFFYIIYMLHIFPHVPNWFNCQCSSQAEKWTIT